MILKIWLFIRLYVALNAVYELVIIPSFRNSPLYIALLFATAIDIIGMIILFEKQKKMGFYLICAACAMVLILDLCIGTHFLHALLRGGIAPAITYLLMLKRWNEFR